jgi:predicted N-acetyltransferase YhbS
MTPIRPLERDDLPAVAALYADFVGWDRDASEPGLVDFFRRTLLEDPFAEADVPALVYEDPQAGVVGVIGSRVRRFHDGDRVVRLACSGPLLAHAEHRRRGVGGLLLRRYLSGPQELTFNDRAIGEVPDMWQRLGGVAHTSASIGWACVVAPAGAAAAALTHRFASAAEPPGAALLARVDALAGRRLRRPSGAGSIEPLTNDALLDLVARLRRAFALRPAYDDAYLTWLFRELDVAAIPGHLVCRLVRADDGRPAGAYVMFVAPRWYAHVVQVVASGADVELVLDHLMHDAAAEGAVEVRGRFEPHLLAALRARRCRLIGADWTLLHSRNRDLLGTVLSSRALFTRLDGEWWMLPHTRAPEGDSDESRRPAARAS